MRIDYYDDPAAPSPQALVVRVFVVVVDPRGRVLVHERVTGAWSLPGGELEPGETLAACAAREVDEETGVAIRDLRFVAALSDPGHVVVKDDRAQQQVAILGCARCAETAPRPSAESPVVRFVSPELLSAVAFDPAQRRYLGLVAEAEPWVLGGAVAAG